MMHTVYGLVSSFSQKQQKKIRLTYIIKTRSVKKSMSKVDKKMQDVEDMTIKLKINPQKVTVLDRQKCDIEE